jgi:hypothetical protein
LHDHLKRCIALRHAHPVLRAGQYQSLFAGDGIYAFSRRLGDDIALVSFNAGHDARSIEVPLPSDADPDSVRSVWGAASFAAGSGFVTSWRIPARSASVLMARAPAK